MFPVSDWLWAVAGGLDSATAVGVSSPEDSAWFGDGCEGTGGAIATVADRKVGAAVADSSSSSSSEPLSWFAGLPESDKLRSTAVDGRPKNGGGPRSLDSRSDLCASASSAPSF